MKKSFLKSLPVLIFIAGASLAFTACSKDAKEPTDETEHKDHEDPQKAVLTLVEGHLHGTYKFHQNPNWKGVIKNPQTITFTNTKEGWKPAEGSLRKFNVRSGASVYGLWIRYYNKAGKDITGEFVSNGQDKIHQHFFIPKNIEKTFDGIDEEGDENIAELFDYTYCDTDPWDKSMKKDDARLVGDKNPVGLKGYFKFKKTRKQFELNIRLMHAAESKFDKDGKTSPFHSPSDAQLQSDHWDLTMKIPVVIYCSRGEFVMDLDKKIDMPEKDIPENEMKYLKSIAKAYGITWQEALKDLKAKYDDSSSEESGELWF